MNCYQIIHALITKRSLLWLYYSPEKQYVTRESNSTSEHVQLVVPLHQNATLAVLPLNTYCQLNK